MLKRSSIFFIFTILLFNSTSLADVVTYQGGLDSYYGINRVVSGHAYSHIFISKLIAASIISIILFAIILVLINKLIKNKKTKIILNTFIIVVMLLLTINRTISFIKTKQQINKEKQVAIENIEKYGTDNHHIIQYNKKFLDFKEDYTSSTTVKFFIDLVDEHNSKYSDDYYHFTIDGINKLDQLHNTKHYSINDFIFNQEEYVIGCTIKEVAD